MKVVRLRLPKRVCDSSVVSVGVFDGIHLGHKSIITQLKDEAEKRNIPSVLVTFDPHPAKLLNPPIRLLTTTEEKIRFLSEKDYAPDWLIILEFNNSLAQKSAEDFVREYLKDSLGMKAILEGEDHRFGHNLSGDIEFHRKLSLYFDYEFILVQTYYINGHPVKSGMIREKVEKGELKSAKELLGHEYFLIGEVIVGDKLGRKLGFPTANILVETDKLLPPDGVYLVRTHLDSTRYYGLLYIGYRPTLGLNNERRIELYIFDFDGELYGEKLFVEFISMIREDKTFDDLNLLKNQIENDKLKALELLGKK